MDSYTNKLVIKTSPQKLYEAITTKKGLSKWWTKQVEIYPEVGGTATFKFGKIAYVVMKIAKMVSNKEFIWKCVEQNFKIKGTNATNEWVGTTIKFSIVQNPDETTTLSFVHEGLNTNLISYKSSNSSWNKFLKSLKSFLETGTGKPHQSK